jgi:hypothetical protein
MTTPQPGQSIPTEQPIAHLVEAVQIRIATQRLKLAKSQAGKLKRT